MPAALGQASKGSTASATSIATGTMATQATGSLIVGAMVFQGTFSAYTDNKSNSPYVQVDSERTVDTTNAAKLRMYYFQNALGGSGATTTAATTTAQPITNCAAEFTGMLTVGALDTNNGGNDTSSPFGNAVSITPSAGRRVLVAAFGGNSGSNPATQAETQGFTVIASAQETNGASFWTACLAYKIVTADGSTAYTAQFTESGATEGGVILAAFKEASSGSDLGARLSNARTRTGPYRFRRPTLAYTSAPSADVTIALTGQALGIAAGTLAPSADTALTGSAISIAAGTLTPSLAITISGSALTSAAGTLVPNLSQALSGQALASAQGTLVPAFMIPLTGLLITIGQGSVSAPGGSGDVTVALTGQAMAFSAGTLVPGTSKVLTGSALAASSGTLGVSRSVALSGIALSISQGSATPALSKALSGQPLAISQGSIGVSHSVSMTGSLLSFGQGAITAVGGTVPIVSPPVRMLTVSWQRREVDATPRTTVVRGTPRRTLH